MKWTHTHTVTCCSFTGNIERRAYSHCLQAAKGSALWSSPLQLLSLKQHHISSELRVLIDIQHASWRHPGLDTLTNSYPTLICTPWHSNFKWLQRSLITNPMLILQWPHNDLTITPKPHSDSQSPANWFFWYNARNTKLTINHRLQPFN